MKHEQNSRFVLCETSRGTLGVEVVAQDILRVFLGRETQNYFSKAVEADRHENCAFTVTEESDTLVIATPALRLAVDAAGRTDFYTAAGKPLSLAWRGARGVIDRGLHDKDLLEKEGHTERYIFGFEESYGYLSGTSVRDIIFPACLFRIMWI